VREGQTASFTVDAFPTRTFEGKVATVRKAALNTNNVVTYTVVVAFTPDTARGRVQLLPGMTANARIVTDTRDDVLKLPNAALRMRLAGVAEPAASAASAAASAPQRGGGGRAGGERAGRGRVYVLDARGQPQAVAVRLGISDGSMTELLGDALQPGQQVVTGTVGSPNGTPARSPLGGARPPF